MGPSLTKTCSLGKLGLRNGCGLLLDMPCSGMAEGPKKGTSSILELSLGGGAWGQHVHPPLLRLFERNTT